MMRFLLITAFLILSSAPALSADLFIRDGDSFAMNGKELRLWGIDAPEYRQSIRPLRQICPPTP